MNPLVTVYITNYNYAQYLSTAIESVINQIYEHWELIIILDGPIDNSKKIAKKYINKYPKKIRLLENYKNFGLQYCANKVLEQSKGKYFIRLDSDDYFNESALLVMVSIMEKDRDIALVYPDYFYVDEIGNILEVDNRKKIDVAVKILDLPAHGACTMLRTAALREVDGYSEEFTAQDGHDIWYKLKDRFKIKNVSTLLFYYRQHSNSLSKDNGKILNERKNIKRKYVGEKYKDYKIAIIIGAKNTYQKYPNLVLTELRSKPLIDYTIDAINELDYNGITVVSTDDDKVVDYCQSVHDLLSIKRPIELSKQQAITENVYITLQNILKKIIFIFRTLLFF